MNLLLLNVLLALAWSALTGSFQPADLAFGFALGYLMLWLFSPQRGSRRYFRQALRLLDLGAYFLFDLLRANLRLARVILSPRMNLRPAVVAVPLDLQDEAAVILLANLISLTPGTLSLDISTNRRTLYIHTFWLEDAGQFRRQLAEGYARRVRELFAP